MIFPIGQACLLTDYELILDWEILVDIYIEEKLVWDFLNQQTYFTQILYSIYFPTDSYRYKIASVSLSVSYLQPSI